MLSIIKMKLMLAGGTTLVCFCNDQSSRWIEELKEIIETPDVHLVRSERDTEKLCGKDTVLVTDDYGAFSRISTRPVNPILSFKSELVMHLAAEPHPEYPWNLKSLWSLTLTGIKIFICGVHVEDVKSQHILAIQNAQIVEDPRTSDVIFCCLSEQAVPWMSGGSMAVVLEAIIHLNVPRKGRKWLTALCEPPDEFQDVIAEYSETELLCGLQFWVPPDYPHDYILANGGQVQSEPSRETLAVIPEGHQFSEFDTCQLRNHQCVLLKESWLKSSCTAGSFGPLEEGLSTCPALPPFYSLPTEQFKNRRIFFDGEMEKGLRDDIKKLSAQVVDNMDLADTVICDRSTLIEVPPTARNLSCWTKWRKEERPHDCEISCHPIFIPPTKRALLEGCKFVLLSNTEEGKNVKHAIIEMGGVIVNKSGPGVQWIWEEPHANKAVVLWATKKRKTNNNLPLFRMGYVRDILRLGKEKAVEENRVTREYVLRTYGQESKVSVPQTSKNQDEMPGKHDVNSGDGPREGLTLGAAGEVDRVTLPGVKKPKLVNEDEQEQGPAQKKVQQTCTVPKTPSLSLISIEKGNEEAKRKSGNSGGILRQTRLLNVNNRMSFLGSPARVVRKRLRKHATPNIPSTPIRSDIQLSPRNLRSEFEKVVNETDHMSASTEMIESQQELPPAVLDPDQPQMEAPVVHNPVTQLYSVIRKAPSIQASTTSSLTSAVPMSTSCTQTSPDNLKHATSVASKATSPINFVAPQMDNIPRNDDVDLSGDVADKIKDQSALLFRLLFCERFKNVMHQAPLPSVHSIQIRVGVAHKLWDIFSSLQFQVVEQDELYAQMSAKNSHHATMYSRAPILVHGVIDFQSENAEFDWLMYASQQIKEMLVELGFEPTETCQTTTNYIRRNHLWVNFAGEQNLPVASIVRERGSGVLRIEVAVYKTLVDCISRLNELPLSLVRSKVSILCRSDCTYCPCRLVRVSKPNFVRYSDENRISPQSVMVFRCGGNATNDSILQIRDQVQWKEIRVSGCVNSTRLDLDAELANYKAPTLPCLNFQYCKTCIEKLRGAEDVRNLLITGYITNGNDRKCAGENCNDNTELYLVCNKLN